MAHKTYEELAEKLERARAQVVVGGRYWHYKSREKEYTVLSVALREDTEEPCVVYQTSHSSQLIWVRSLSDWTSEIVTESGEKVPHFELIEP